MPSLTGNDITVRVGSTADTSGIDKTREGIEGIGTEAKTSEGKQSGFISGLGTMGKGLGIIAAVFAAQDIVGSIKNFGTASFAAAGELEQTNQSFQTLIGNKEKADKLFGGLAQYSFQTPFETGELVDSAKQLLAFGEDSGDVTDEVKKLGDVAASGGGDLKGLSLVAGQIFSKGKIDAQDFYQLINNGGAGVAKVLKDQAGGFGNLMKQFENGGVPVDKFREALDKVTSEGGSAFQGTAKQADTFDGKLSSLKDSAKLLGLALIGVKIDPETGLQIQPGGMFDNAKKLVDNLSTAFNNAQPYITLVSNKLTEIGTAIGTAVQPYIDEFIKSWKEEIEPTLEKNKPVLEAIAELIGITIAAAIVTFIAIVDILLKTFAAVIDIMGKVGQAMADAWIWASNAWSGAAGFFKDLSITIYNVFRGAFNGVADLWNKTVGSLRFSVPKWVPGLGGNTFDVADIPKFATGTNNFNGGYAIVGEQGPELVNLPRGSQVKTNTQSQGMMNGMGSNGGIIVNQQIYNQVDYDKGIMQLGFMLRSR